MIRKRFWNLSDKEAQLFSRLIGFPDAGRLAALQAGHELRDEIYRLNLSAFYVTAPLTEG